MTKQFADISHRRAAIIGGLALLIMTIFAVFAIYFVFEELIVHNDALKTANNIKNNETLFRAGICSYLIVIMGDVLVAWALYVFFKPINKNLSLLAAWFRLVYSTIFGIALVNHLHFGFDLKEFGMRNELSPNNGSINAPIHIQGMPG